MTLSPHRDRFLLLAVLAGFPLLITLAFWLRHAEPIWIAVARAYSMGGL